MSFVDARVIQARMAKKDARLNKALKAKLLSCTEGETRTKINGAEECLNTQTAPDRNGQTLKKGAHRVTAIPNLTSPDPVRTDNKVHETAEARVAREGGERCDVEWDGKGTLCREHRCELPEHHRGEPHRCDCGRTRRWMAREAPDVEGGA